MPQPAKVPSLVLVACILTGCVLVTIWLVIVALTMYLSFRGPRWILALSLSIVVVLIGLTWTKFYRLSFIKDDIRDSDPRIYVTIRESDAATSPCSFLLTNLGGGVAHNVQVEPLTICGRHVIFPQVPVIPVRESKDSFAKIGVQGSQPLRTNDLFQFMEEDWSTSQGNITGEWSVPVIVSYDDYTGVRTIESAMMLIFFPMQYRLQQKQSTPSLSDPTYEFRHVTFSLVKNSKDETHE
jgi:hypothetical protein